MIYLTYQRVEQITNLCLYYIYIRSAHVGLRQPQEMYFKGLVAFQLFRFAGPTERG